MTPRTAHRLGLALGLATALVLVLASGALGIIGDGRADRGYLAVPLVLLVGAAVTRLRPRGMAVVLLLAALAQVVVPVAAFAVGAPGTDDASLLDVTGLTAAFAGSFLVAASLSRRAPRPGPGTAARRA